MRSIRSSICHDFVELLFKRTTSEAWSATATPWDKRFPSLEFFPLTKYIDGPPASILYFEGEMAQEIYDFLKNSQSQGIFMQYDKKYIVQVDVVLPHETVINAYQ
jgi:hypothetical protein